MSNYKLSEIRNLKKNLENQIALSVCEGVSELELIKAMQSHTKSETTIFVLGFIKKKYISV